MEYRNLRKRCAAGVGIAVMTLSLCGSNAAAMASVRQQPAVQSVTSQQNTTQDDSQKKDDSKDNQKYKLSNYVIPKNDQDTASAITYYLNNPDKVSQEELDAVCLDYLKNTMDMKSLMKIMNSLSMDTVDQMAEYYIKESKDYEMFDDLKGYLSKKASKSLNNFVKKALAEAAKKGKECIDDYLKHPEKYSQKKLDEAIAKYVKENKDIKVVFKVIDHLSKDTINQIVTTYLKETKDWKVLKSFKKYISKDVFNELSKLAKKELLKLFN